MANANTVIQRVLKEFPNNHLEFIHSSSRKYYIIDEHDNRNRYMLSVNYGTFDRFLKYSIHLSELDLEYRIIGYVADYNSRHTWSREYDYMRMSIFNKTICKSIVNDINTLAENRQAIRKALEHIPRYCYRIYRCGDITLYLEGDTAHAVKNGKLL